MRVGSKSVIKDSTHLKGVSNNYLVKHSVPADFRQSTAIFCVLLYYSSIPTTNQLVHAEARFHLFWYQYPI